MMKNESIPLELSSVAKGPRVNPSSERGKILPPNKLYLLSFEEMTLGNQNLILARGVAECKERKKER